MLPIEDYLNDLKDNSTPLSISKLASLSDLSVEESQLFNNAWGDIDVNRRRQIASQLVDITSGNYRLELDEAFRTILGDEDTETRLKAIEGLENCEDASFIQPFIALLDTKYDTKTRATSVAALGQFAILAELGKLSTFRSSQVEDALMIIIRNKKEESEVRRRAIEAVAPISREQVKQTIRRAYDNPDSAFKRSALCAMGRNCDPIWLPFLLKELRNPDPEIRYEAAIACGELCTPEAIPQLLKLTKDAKIHIQLAAISSLGHIGSIEAKGILQKQLQSTDERIRKASEVALEELGFAEDPLSFDEISD